MKILLVYSHSPLYERRRLRVISNKGKNTPILVEATVRPEMMPYTGGPRLSECAQLSHVKLT